MNWLVDRFRMVCALVIIEYQIYLYVERMLLVLLVTLCETQYAGMHKTRCFIHMSKVLKQVFEKQCCGY